MQLDPQEAADTGSQMTIVDTDRVPVPTTISSTAPLRIAYVSVGEAEDRRPYWSRIEKENYLVVLDKETEGNTRVDFRDAAWQTLLLKEEIPRILTSGAQGLMLAHLDSIAFLEDREPEHFAGSLHALQLWLVKLRNIYPGLILIAEGTKTLEPAAIMVDGYLTDGIFTEWNAVGHHARRRTTEERDERLDDIGNAFALTPHPVFNLEYADVGDKRLTRWVTQESVKRGYRPFIKIR